MRLLKIISFIFILFFSSTALCDESKEIEGISIVAPTIRQEYMENIFANYSKQDYPKKELIIVLNKNSLDINVWEEKAQEYENVRVYRVDEKKSLGACLNFGFEKAKYEYLTKMRDRDRYLENYLTNSMKQFSDKIKLEVVGKSRYFVFFEENKELGQIDNGPQFSYAKEVHEETLLFKKEVFEKIKFDDSNLNVSIEFCKKCWANQFRIASSDAHDYCSFDSSHTHDKRKSSGEYSVVSENVDDYEAFLSWEQADNLTPITINTIKQMQKNDRYYMGREKYMGKAIELINDLMNNENITINNVLELGPYKMPMIYGSDVMDKDLLMKNVKYHWDAERTPWPIKDKQYDLFIALQVFEHLGNKQIQAFREVIRTSKMAIISLPYMWENSNNMHDNIDEKVISAWTLGLEPAYKAIMTEDGDINRKIRRRAIYLFVFD